MSYVSNNAVYEFSDSTRGVPLRRNDRWSAASAYKVGKARRSKGRINPGHKASFGSTAKKARKRPR